MASLPMKPTKSCREMIFATSGMATNSALFTKKCFLSGWPIRISRFTFLTPLSLTISIFSSIRSVVNLTQSESPSALTLSTISFLRSNRELMISTGLPSVLRTSSSFHL